MTPRSAQRLRALTAALAVLATGCGGAGRGAGGAAAAPDERFVFFTPGSAQIVSNDGFFSIGYVTAMLDREPRYYVLIVGHADPTGTAEANRKLCFDRARAVRRVLVDHGVPEKRILIAAPRELLDVAEAALSRRADIYLYDPVDEEVSHRLGYEVEIREQ
jgi:hypothetical protein